MPLSLRLFLSAIIIAIAGWFTPPGRSYETATLISAARWLQTNGFEAQSLPFYTLAMSALPDAPALPKARGQALAALYLHEAAIADYTKALSLNALDTETLYLRAKAFAANRAYDEARSDFDEALQRYPNNPTYLLERAKFAFDRRDAARAAADVKTLLDLYAGTEWAKSAEELLSRTGPQQAHAGGATAAQN